MAFQTVWQSNQPLFNRIPATPIQFHLNSNGRIRQPVALKRCSFSSTAARNSIASTLVRSHIIPELFKNSQLLIKDEVELYSKRLGLRTGEIRLLFIVPNADLNSQIELLMFRRLLDEAPPYQALSYTGGYPFPHSHHDVEEEERSYQLTKIVLVNGIEFPVKLNQYQALLRFRRTHPSVALWIDSICINEGDPIERPEQVRIMGEIYGKSEEVIIWLGEVASRSETNIALGMIKGIIKSFVSWYNVKNPSGFLVYWELMKRKAETTPDSVDQKLFWK
jgi:Heterokaryon incompatibility protein (HET)